MLFSVAGIRFCLQFLRFSKACRHLPVLLCSALLFTSGCGYGFRSNSNIWEREKITRLYVQPFTNNTLVPGAEIPFLSAVLREFSRQGRVRLVASKENADGILAGAVLSVTSKVGPVTPATQLAENMPRGSAPLPSNFLVAAEYVAGAEVAFSLKKAEGNIVWSRSFGRSKIYPGSNQPGDIGNTSVLINQSRFSNAIGEIAQGVAGDAHDILFEAF